MFVILVCFSTSTTTPPLCFGTAIHSMVPQARASTASQALGALLSGEDADASQVENYLETGSENNLVNQLPEVVRDQLSPFTVVTRSDPVFIYRELLATLEPGSWNPNADIEMQLHELGVSFY